MHFTSALLATVAPLLLASTASAGTCSNPPPYTLNATIWDVRAAQYTFSGSGAFCEAYAPASPVTLKCYDGPGKPANATLTAGTNGDATIKYGDSTLHVSGGTQFGTSGYYIYLNAPVCA